MSVRETEGSTVAVHPLHRPFEAVIEPPGSKSETNRYLALAALADGPSVIHRPLRSADTDAFVDALHACGVDVARRAGRVNVHPAQERMPGGCSVHLGDGGTPTRFMMAIASTARRPVLIDGSARMRERPIAEGVELLRSLGARIEYAEAEGRLPVRVGGGRMPTGGTVEAGRTLSSQFISAILLLGARLERGVDLFVKGEELTSPSYVELTIAALQRFGVQVTVLRDTNGRLSRVTVAPGAIPACDVMVEPDASSAVYFLGAATLVRDSRVTIRGLPRLSRQPDAACLAALCSMGAREWSGPAGLGIEGTATLNGIDVDASRWPDGALCVAAVASMAKGSTRIRGLETLKVKESNRVQVLVDELAKLGCASEAGDGFIVIHPSSEGARAAVIDPHGDHRVAMTFAMLGLARPGISIADPACVAKSYPGFWEDLATLSGAARR